LTHDALQPAQLSVVVVKVIDRRVRARAVAPPLGAHDGATGPFMRRPSDGAVVGAERPVVNGAAGRGGGGRAGRRLMREAIRPDEAEEGGRVDAWLEREP
jgi:hypothetical protein